MIDLAIMLTVEGMGVVFLVLVHLSAFYVAHGKGGGRGEKERGKEN